MIRLLLFLLLIPTCLVGQESASLKFSSLNPELKMYANAVVRYEVLDIELHSSRSMITREERTVTVLNEEGLRHLHAFLHFTPSIKVKKLGAEVYNARGEEIKKFRKGDFKEQSAVSGGQLYTESKVYYLPFTPTTYPFTFRFYSETETSNTAFIPAWYFYSGYNVSVEHSEMKVRYDPSETELQIKERHLDGIGVIKEETPGLLRYEARDLPAIKYEELAPAVIDFTPKVEIVSTSFQLEGVSGKARGWKELGQWMHEHLVDGLQELDQTTVNRIKALTSHTTDTLEKARIVYEYMQENTRYIGVQVGIGGFRPIAAIEVDRVKYGDCKGLSNYTKALLEAIGIPSYYVHVEAGENNKDFYTDFASVGQGNHVILAIPYQGDFIWLECTSQTLPFNFLGDFTDDRNVCLITPEGGVITRTPKYGEDLSLMDSKALVTLSEDGSLNASLQIETGGHQYKARYMLERLSDRDKLEFYQKKWRRLQNVSVQIDGLINDKKAVTFTEELQIGVSNYLGTAGDLRVFKPNVFNAIYFQPARYRERKLPFVIQTGLTDKDFSEIILPDGWIPEPLPGEVKLDSPFGTYQASITLSDTGSILYQRKLTLNAGQYSAGDYEAYRDFLKAVVRADAQSVVIKPAKT